MIGGPTAAGFRLRIKAKNSEQALLWLQPIRATHQSLITFHSPFVSSVSLW